MLTRPHTHTHTNLYTILPAERVNRITFAALLERSCMSTCVAVSGFVNLMSLNICSNVRVADLSQVVFLLFQVYDAVARWKDPPKT